MNTLIETTSRALIVSGSPDDIELELKRANRDSFNFISLHVVGVVDKQEVPQKLITPCAYRINIAHIIYFFQWGLK